MDEHHAVMMLNTMNMRMLRDRTSRNTGYVIDQSECAVTMDKDTPFRGWASAGTSTGMGVDLLDKIPCWRCGQPSTQTILNSTSTSAANSICAECETQVEAEKEQQNAISAAQRRRRVSSRSGGPTLPQEQLEELVETISPW